MFPSAAEWEAWRPSAQPVDTPELFGWIADIRTQLLGVWREKIPDVFFAKKTPDVFSDAGLAIFTDADPGSEQAAALMAAIMRAVAPPALTDAEREPDTLAAATLQGWQRTAARSSSAGRAGDRNDGRWFWLVALALFGVEAWMRRRPDRTQSEVAHADAA